MAENARVESIDALKKFRAAMCKFAETVRVGLDEAEAEVQRATHWVKQEQQNHWKAQWRKRSELYTRAKSDLSRKKSQRTALGGRYSCIDEEKALAAAERRLEEAKQKQANVRRWSRLLDEESFAYKSVAQSMSTAVEVEVPNAVAQLDRMIEALEAYATSTAPSEQRSTAATAAGEDVGRPAAYASVARETPSEPADAAARYRRLRAFTPSQTARDATAVSETRADGLKWEAVDGPAWDALARIDAARSPILGADKLVRARGSECASRVYLERLKDCPAGDSGWYIGVVDDAAAVEYEAVRIQDVVAGSSRLEALLELPGGWLVVLDRGAIEAVLDPQDRLCDPAATPAPE